MHILIPNKNISFHSVKGFVTVDASNPKFLEVVKLCDELRYDEAYALQDLRSVVEAEIKGSRVTLEGDVVKFDGEVVQSLLSRRIVEMVRKGISVTALVKFLENLMENPSARAVDELYGFLEASKLPLTQDGCFLAYKSVKANYKDKHTGTIDNSPGTVVKMTRNKVNDNKDQTCSTGLHFAAHNYAKNFGGGSDKMVVLKINPRDVVSIPSDYKNEKGRCCEYEVILDVPRNNSALVGEQVVDVNTFVPKVTFVDDVFEGRYEDFPINDKTTEYDMEHDGTTGHTYWDCTFHSVNAKGHYLFQTQRNIISVTPDTFTEWTIELADA